MKYEIVHFIPNSMHSVIIKLELFSSERVSYAYKLSRLTNHGKYVYHRLSKCSAEEIFILGEGFHPGAFSKIGCVNF